jgi:tetratricopeptide (TPR) repeat protein
MQARRASVLARLVLAFSLLLIFLLPTGSSGQTKKPQPAKPPAKQPATRATDAGDVGRHGGWHVKLDKDATIRAAGEYDTNVEVELESFSALTLEPSSTSKYEVFTIPDVPRTLGREEAARVKGPRRQLVFQDSRPGLKPNPDKEATPFFTRAEGAISALSWVQGQFGDVRVSGIVNTEHGPNGQGAKSRMGLMARWDAGNNYYWFLLNFASGEFSILRSRYFGVFEVLPKSVGKIADFRNTKAYRMEFDLVGDTLQGKVYDQKKLVGDTGKVTDPDPQRFGMSGFLTELAIEAPYEPLEGSVTDLASVALAAMPSAQKQPAVQTAEAAALARKGTSQATAGQTREAASTFEQALKTDPNNLSALAGLAWIKATDKEQRQPQEAVRLATKAFDGFFRAYNQRRITNQPPPSTAEAVRIGMSVAAAYASVGKFKPRVSSDRVEMAGLDEAQARAMAASVGEAAEPFAQWALEVARGEQRTNPGPESDRLVTEAQQVLSQVQRGQVPAVR